MKKRLHLILVFTLALAVVAGIVTAVCFLTDPVDKAPDDATEQTDPSDTTNQTAEKFLKGECKFAQITEFIEKAMQKAPVIEKVSLEDIAAADSLAREIVKECC